MTTTTEHDVIRCEVDADGIALLTIDYPGKTMNVIDQAFIDSLQRGIDRVAGDAAIKGAIVTSGKEAFVAEPHYAGEVGRTRSTTYDALDRPLVVQHADGSGAYGHLHFGAQCAGSSYQARYRPAIDGRQEIPGRRRTGLSP
mgnify:CR=1 FL=1